MGDRVAVVTGGGRGIGLSIAKALCGDGLAVAIVDVEQKRLESAVQELQGAGHQVMGITGDVVRPVDVDRIISKTERRLGAVDVLVNNVGVFIPEPNRAEDTDFAAWRRVIDVNVNGTFLMSQRAGRSMIARGKGGAIVNIASIYGMRTLDWRLYDTAANPDRYDDASYHVSKAGVIQLTQSLAVTWAGFGIRVNCVSPGVIDTASNREVMPAGAFRKIARRVPMGRWGTTDEIADAVAFLASDKARYVTGANLVVDGGWICW
jgi:NAD(P)-dependent dehydrogenase (short-subunit alcohol dehydrogenase family)